MIYETAAHMNDKFGWYEYPENDNMDAEGPCQAEQMEQINNLEYLRTGQIQMGVRPGAGDEVDTPDKSAIFNLHRWIQKS